MDRIERLENPGERRSVERRPLITTTMNMRRISVMSAFDLVGRALYHTHSTTAGPSLLAAQK